VNPLKWLLPARAGGGIALLLPQKLESSSIAAVLHLSIAAKTSVNTERWAASSRNDGLAATRITSADRSKVFLGRRVRVSSAAIRSIKGSPQSIWWTVPIHYQLLN
jgi:hypothetical protein